MIKKKREDNNKDHPEIGKTINLKSVTIPAKLILKTKEIMARKNINLPLLHLQTMMMTIKLNNRTRLKRLALQLRIKEITLKSAKLNPATKT